jgi:hypothetical protein
VKARLHRTELIGDCGTMNFLNLKPTPIGSPQANHESENSLVPLRLFSRFQATDFQMADQTVMPSRSRHRRTQPSLKLCTPLLEATATTSWSSNAIVLSLAEKMRSRCKSFRLHEFRKEHFKHCRGHSIHLRNCAAD